MSIAEKINVPEAGTTLYRTKSPPLRVKESPSCFQPPGSSQFDMPLGARDKSKVLDWPATTSSVDERVNLSAVRAVRV